MKHFALQTILFFFFLAPAHALMQHHTLGVGSSFKVKVQPNQDLRVTGGKHIQVSDEGSTIVVTGKSPGTSIVWSQPPHEIRVVPAHVYKTYIKFRSELKSIKNIDLKIKIENNKVVVFGRLNKFLTWVALKNLSQKSNLNYRFQAYVRPNIEEQISEYFNLALNENFRIIWEPHIQIEMLYPSPKTKSLQVLKAFGLLDTNKLNSSIKPLIEVQLTIAEVSKSSMKDLGIQWGLAGETQVLPSIINSQVLAASLNALQTKGHAQIFARPQLVGRSGSPIEFHSGGEWPIKIAGYKVKNIVWKKHGLILNVTPAMAHSNYLQLKVQLELSTLDPGQGTKDVPGLKLNRLNSEVDLMSSSTVALAGFVQKSIGNNREQLALLGDIPILGGLFRSKNFNQQKSELVIFLTPKVVGANKIYQETLPQFWQEF